MVALRPTRPALAFAVIALTVTLVRPAAGRADDRAVLARIEQLNKRAMDAYDLLDFAEARKLLNEAVIVAKRGGVDGHSLLAKTYLDLGIVYVAGLKDLRRGQQAFIKALQIRPDSRLEQAIATPELQEVFDSAREALGMSRLTRPPADKTGSGGPSSGNPTSNPDEGHNLSHGVIEEAPAGKEISVRTQIPPELQVARVYLYYRGSGRDDFISSPMVQREGAYIGTIPVEATNGSSVQYYIEARDAHGRPLVASGAPSSPNVINLVKQSEEKAASGGGSGQTETGRVEKSAEREGEGGASKAWITLGLGMGMGVATGNSDLANASITPGVAPALLFHIAPEIGYFVSERVAVSLQGRIQLFPMAEPPPGQGMPSTGAIAALLRLHYYFSRDKFRGYMTLAAGAGHLRHTVDISAGQPNAATDTVDSGPFFVGPGMGLQYDLTPRIFLVFEIQGLAGLDHWTANADANLGLAFHL